MSALGLTCREAFTVFSQNETLRLQQEVLRLEKVLADVNNRFIRFKLRHGYAGQGCYYGDCAVCERNVDKCRCDWTCDCKDCDDDRAIMKSEGWTDDEMRTVRLHTNEGCIQICDICDAAHDEECLCDWTCECRVCEELRDTLRHDGWTDQQLKDYNRFYSIRRMPKPAGCIQICDICDAAHDEECLCDWTCECRVCEDLRGRLENDGWTDQQLKDYNRFYRLDPYWGSMR